MTAITKVTTVQTDGRISRESKYIHRPSVRHRDIYLSFDMHYSLACIKHQQKSRKVFPFRTSHYLNKNKYCIHSKRQQKR